MTKGTANGITPNGKGWEWGQSFWMLFALVPWLNGLGFFYIALRTKRVKWAIWGLVYEIPVVLYGLFVTVTSNSWKDDVSFLALVLAYIGAIVHSFLARKEFLLRLYAIKNQSIKQAELMKESIGNECGVDMGNAESTKEAAVATEQPEQAATVTQAEAKQPEETKPVVAELLSHVEPIITEPYPLEAPPLPPSEPQQPAEAPPVVAATAGTMQSPPPPPLPLATGDGLVDLNHATEEAIAALPGIGLIYAKRAVSEREAIGGFQSLEQFGQKLGFKPHVVERIRPYVTLTPMKKTPVATVGGRVVDV